MLSTISSYIWRKPSEEGSPATVTPDELESSAAENCSTDSLHEQPTSSGLNSANNDDDVITVDGVHNQNFPRRSATGKVDVEAPSPKRLRRSSISTPQSEQATNVALRWDRIWKKQVYKMRRHVHRQHWSLDHFDLVHGSMIYRRILENFSVPSERGFIIRGTVRFPDDPYSTFLPITRAVSPVVFDNCFRWFLPFQKFQRNPICRKVARVTSNPWARN